MRYGLLFTGFLLIIVGGVGKVIVLQKHARALGRRTDYVTFTQSLHASPRGRRERQWTAVMLAGMGVAFYALWG